MTTSSAADEVAALTSDLIRIDTTNTGDPATLAGAEYVAEQLTEVGFEPQYIETGPKRGNVVVRLPGWGALLVHDHLDVVPADPAE